jgi:YrbI family 3-deoxy-D-manno-octulosonate 8-phosphate phosphatase
MNQKLKEKIKKIKLIATDVDGVLTDGGMYYSSKGDTLKKFQAIDGMAVSILKRNTIPTVIITKERNQIVKQWSSKMNIDRLFDGIKNKEKLVPKLCKLYSLSENNIAYIGDDVNDLEILKRVGFSITPKDGNLEVKKIVDCICKSSGGEGVLREICDLVISVKFGKKRKLY